MAVFPDKGGRQARNAPGHLEIVRAEVSGELFDRLRLLKADFRVLGDPVAHGQ